MRLQILAFILLSLNVCGQTKNNSKETSSTPNFDTIQTQKEIMSDYSPTFDKAHPNAKRLMNEDFYFSTIDETAPFGNDDGADTYAGFEKWRRTHKSDKPKVYLLEQMDSWGYPKFDIYETDIKKLTPYLKQNSLGSVYMSGVDAEIIAIAFGQLYLEGSDSYKKERELKLKKMLSILNS